MKRAKRLFEHIVSMENLREATYLAMKGKRDRRVTREFVSKLNRNLLATRELLLSGRYPFGAYRQFVIYEPKKRVISAPCFRDRVVHHAIVRVCEPSFERCLIADTFACRRGLGQHAAIRRAFRFSQRFNYFLKLDIRKYFDSIRHDHLLAILERRFKEPRLIALFRQIIESFRSEYCAGIPIGSLMSQHFANLYLGVFDRWVKKEVGDKGYVRYMDDMILWSTQKRRLVELGKAADCFLRERLGLRLKPPIYLNRTRHGVDFLGMRVFRNRVTLNRRSRVRIRKRFRELNRMYENGWISEAEMQQRSLALSAATCAAGISSDAFRRGVFCLE